MMRRIFLLILTLFVPALTSANPIPSVSNPSGTDRVRTSEGASCEQAISTGKTIQFGTYGATGNEDSDNYYGGDPNNYS
ncbi:hypothetical protein QTO02_26115, partial [Vibrio fortis]